MTDINSMNAVIAHRAKLREEVINLPFTYTDKLDGVAVVKRADVLKLLNQN